MTVSRNPQAVCADLIRIPISVQNTALAVNDLSGIVVERVLTIDDAARMVYR